MKNVILFVVLFTVLMITQSAVVSSKSIFVSESYITEGERPWWDIFGVRNGYYTINTIEKYVRDTVQKDILYSKMKVECKGNGSNKKVEAVFFDPENVLPNNLADKSYKLMMAHVQNSISKGILKGSQDFNIVIGEQFYIRRVTWSGSASHTNVVMTIEIL